MSEQATWVRGLGPAMKALDAAVVGVRARVAEIESSRQADIARAYAEGFAAGQASISPQPTEPSPDLLSPEEAANRLRCGRTTIYHLMRTGELESVRVRKLRRIPVRAIEDYIVRLRNGVSEGA